jgi:hypothetical protein
MRHSWAGTGIFRWRGSAWFGATDGPPLSSVFGEVAHLAAARGSLSVRAAAVASSDMRSGETGGFVCPGGKGEDADGETEIQECPDGDASETLRTGGCHAGTVSG